MTCVYSYTHFPCCQMTIGSICFSTKPKCDNVGLIWVTSQEACLLRGGCKNCLVPSTLDNKSGSSLRWCCKWCLGSIGVLPHKAQIWYRVGWMWVSPTKIETNMQVLFGGTSIRRNELILFKPSSMNVRRLKKKLTCSVTSATSLQD